MLLLGQNNIIFINNIIFLGIFEDFFSLGSIQLILIF